MAKYLINAQYTVNLHTTIEADSEQEAWDIARDLDGGEFKEDSDGAFSDWEIYNVSEVTK